MNPGRGVGIGPWQFILSDFHPRIHIKPWDAALIAINNTDEWGEAEVLHDTMQGHMLGRLTRELRGDE